jgi:hypothetical protein
MAISVLHCTRRQLAVCAAAVLVLGGRCELESGHDATAQRMADAHNSAADDPRIWHELAGLAREIDALDAEISIKERALLKQRRELMGYASRASKGNNDAALKEPTAQPAVTTAGAVSEQPQSVTFLTSSAHRATPQRDQTTSVQLSLPINRKADRSIVQPNNVLLAHVRNVLKLPPGATIIFTAATKGFIRGVVNWLALLHRLELMGNVFIFAMDDETHAWFTSRGLATYPYIAADAEYTRSEVPKGGGNKLKRMQVWYERSRLVRDLLNLGHTVVQSDGDALWLQNPLFELAALPPNVDVAFSRGNARAGTGGRGTGVCMGFVMYRPTFGAVAFLQDILDRMLEVYDVDQGIANSFVGGSRGLNRDKDKYNTGVFFGQYKSTRWAQLPQVHAFTRHCTPTHSFLPYKESLFSFCPML